MLPLSLWPLLGATVPLDSCHVLSLLDKYIVFNIRFWTIFGTGMGLQREYSIPNAISIARFHQVFNGFCAYIYLLRYHISLFFLFIWLTGFVTYVTLALPYMAMEELPRFADVRP